MDKLKKIISFSLWGSKPMYTIGALENIKLAKTIFKDWTCRFYCADTVPEEIIKRLEVDGEVVRKKQKTPFDGLFWRFEAADSNDIVISRDTDSRLSEREKFAIDEWLKSNKDFHIMRDHPAHNVEILGGMWGSRNGILKGINNKIESWKNKDVKGVDQTFLSKYIWPIVKSKSMIHDEIMYPKRDGAIKFPHKRVDKHFVGEIFDENNVRNPDHWKMIK